MKQVKDYSIVIGVLARDCAQALPDNIKRLEELGSFFKSYQVIVYENDSKDQTKDLLKSWSERNAHVTAIMEQTDLVTIPQESSAVPYPAKSVFRIQKMANFRNRLMDEVQKRYHPDFFCLFDIDIACFEPSSVVGAIEKAPDDWGGLFANGAIYMKYSDHEQPHFMQYDSYAYVDDGVDPAKSKAWVVDKDYHIVTGSRMTWKLRKQAYLPCHSAFNGLGIYRWDLIKDQRYTIQQTPELKALHACFCEHVPFNMAIIQKGFRNYMVRDLRVVYWYEQPKEKTGLGRWQNHYRALYYFQGRLRLATKTLCHMLKEHWKLFPYLSN